MNQRIKELRKKLGLTQTVFGKRLGVGKTAISSIETNVCTVTERMFKSICREFNVNEEWLATGEGDMFLSLFNDEQISDFVARVIKEKDESFKKRYIAMLSSLDDDGWEALERVASIMMESKKDQVSLVQHSCNKAVYHL